MASPEIRSLNEDYPEAFFTPPAVPCLSLYQPTHRSHPDAQEDPIRYKNLVRELETSLSDMFDAGEVEAMLAPFRELAEDAMFWSHTLDGLAVFGVEGRAWAYRLQRTMPERAVVADSFHTKPMLRVMQSADRFQVLALDRESVRLFEGNRDVLDEIDLHEDVPATLEDALGEDVTEEHLTVASYGSQQPGTTAMHHGHGGRKDALDVDIERYFRAVDRAITDRHSKPSGLPLVLAALSEYHGVFRDLSKNPNLSPATVDAHPASLSADELRERAWQALEPQYLARLSALVDTFGTARANGKGAADLTDIGRAVAERRVAYLLIDADRMIPGRLDAETGRVLMDELDEPDVDDLLDDFGERTLQFGGEVVIVPTERMPVDTGAAAIYRY